MKRSIVLFFALCALLGGLVACGSSDGLADKADRDADREASSDDGDDEAVEEEPSGDPIPLPVAPPAGADAPDGDACSVLDTYVTRDELGSIYEAHGFDVETWSSGGATSWENAWTDRWSSTCLLFEYPAAEGSDTEKVGFDLSNYGDGKSLAPADVPVPALGPQGQVSAAIGYIIWEQDGWRLTIQGGHATEDDLQASIEAAMLIHDRIVEGPGAEIPADVDHDAYLVEEDEEQGAGGPGDLFGSVEFSITTDNGYVWKPTIFVSAPDRYEEAQRSIDTSCTTADQSVVGVLSVGISVGYPGDPSSDVNRTLGWQFGGYPSGTGFSGSSCFSPDSGLVVSEEAGESSLNAEGYLLLPGYFSPAQPDGDLEIFYDLTLAPSVSPETMQALGISSYEVAVTKVMYTEGTGDGEMITVPADELAALDGVLSYRIFAPR